MRLILEKYSTESRVLHHRRIVKAIARKPILNEQDGRYWITETNKTTARVHELDVSMLNRTHHVAAIVDGGPNILTFLVDGHVNDGGFSRAYGWGRFDDALLSDCNGSSTLTLSPLLDGQLSEFRFYDRYLLNSEMTSNYRACTPRLMCHPNSTHRISWPIRVAPPRWLW